MKIKRKTNSVYQIMNIIDKKSSSSGKENCRFNANTATKHK